MGGIGTGQREEPGEALLLCADVHEGGGCDAGYDSNRAAKVAAHCLVVTLSVDKLTVEYLLLLIHKFRVQ